MNKTTFFLKRLHYKKVKKMGRFRKRLKATELHHSYMPIRTPRVQIFILQKENSYW